MSKRNAVKPPLWAVVLTVVASGALGVRAATTLGLAAGSAWLWALAGLGLVGLAGLAVDAITRENRARNRPRVALGFLLMHLLVVAVLVQVPVAVWRVQAGDPDVRAAKAYSEEIASERWSSLDDQGLIGPGEDATMLPGKRELPRFVHEHGIWFGVRDGRAHLGFARTRPDRVEQYVYDLDRDRWSRTVSPSGP